MVAAAEKLRCPVVAAADSSSVMKTQVVEAVNFGIKIMVIIMP